MSLSLPTTIQTALLDLAATQNRTIRSGGWSSLRCPAHDDRHASLRVRLDGDGRVGLWCGAGCTRTDILDALRVVEEPFRARPWTPPPPPPAHSKPEHAQARGADLYLVRDIEGRVKAIKARFPTKAMSWYSPWIRCPQHPGVVCWVQGLIHVDSPTGDRMSVSELPLYGTHFLKDSPRYTPDRSLYLVEGEKTADAVRKYGGQPALGTVTGAGGTPDESVLQVLRGRHVILCPDNDDAGRQHMDRIGRLLWGITASLKWLDAPDGSPEHWDLADLWVPKGLTHA